MKFIAVFFVLSLGSLSWALKVGDTAPTFSVKGSDGKTHKLDDYKGRYVVLEWHNKDCPFVKKHYSTGNMQSLQKKWTAQGVAWLAVISSAPGKQGYETATDAEAEMKSSHATPTATLLDPTSEVAHLYDAKTTPHMFVINPEGKVIYNGAIDDKATTDKDDVKTAKNYVSEALEESMAGKPIAVASTTPYGCSVKYK